MTITKSIRLEPDELQQVAKVISHMPAATEAGGLKHLLMLGLSAQKKDLVVQLYTRDQLTSGEIAEELDMSRLEVLHILEERKVHILDIDAEQFAQDLRRSL